MLPNTTAPVVPVHMHNRTLVAMGVYKGPPRKKGFNIRTFEKYSTHMNYYEEGNLGFTDVDNQTLD